MNPTTLPNLTDRQWQTVFTAVRRYQFDKTVLSSEEYWECSHILDELFDLAYTQRKEQPT
jgi:hypothetical protein